MTQAIKSVSFSAMVPGINKHTNEVVGWRCLPVEFKLGPDKCGKVCERLDVAKISGGLSIIQYCSDGEAKEFVYLDKDIVGRVHVLHREGRPNDQTTGTGDGSRN